MLRTSELNPSLLSRPVLPSLRVTIISDSVVERNGVGTYYKDLADHLSDLGIGVDLICPKLNNGHELDSFGVPLPGDTTQSIFFPRRKAIGERLDLFRPHVLIIPTLGPYSFTGAREGRRRNIPIVIGHHTDYDKLVKLYWRPFFSAAGSYSLRALHSQLLRYADAVITCNEESVKGDLRLRDRRVFLVGTPLSKKFLVGSNRTGGKSIRKVLFVGRLSCEKNVDLVVAAARQLPGICFQIVGDGPLRDHLQQSTQDLRNIHFTGWVHRDRVLCEIDQCDLLILPSEIETFGTVALEGLARQRAVLVSTHCGIYDWPSLAQGLFSIGAGEGIGDAIVRISKMGEDDRDGVIQKGWEAVHEWNEVSLSGWLQILMGLVDTRFSLPNSIEIM